jgi:hypothetical protein
VTLNTLIRTVRHEFSYRKFTIIVGAQHAQLAAALCLRSGLRATFNTTCKDPKSMKNGFKMCFLFYVIFQELVLFSTI